MGQRASRGLVVAALLGISWAGCSGKTSWGDARTDGGPNNDGYGKTDLRQVLTVSPTDPQVVVETGKAVPSIQFVAKLGNATVIARWALEKAALGSISSSGLFTPSGNTGGQSKVFATVGTLSAGTVVTVILKMTQNGATTQNGNPGPGGFGGVGGEGLGPAVPADVNKLLDAPSAAPADFKLLYPYDQTVWPLGILAPLIQWSALPQGTGDGVLIQLSAAQFEWKGYFGRPAALPAGAPFVRHPIPQDVWKAATRTAAGASLNVKVTVASGGAAYGPLAQNWTIAAGSLRGTVYYQSYGTNLAKNYEGALGVPDGRFGGATLAIKGGSTDPVLVAGKDGGTPDCRVCHSVAAGGSRMVVQRGNDYKASSSYDLMKAYQETAYPSSTDGQLGWIGMTPDGTLGLGNAAPISGEANTVNTALYDMATGQAVAATGLTTFVTQAGFPAFAPDAKRMAFNFYAGPGDVATGAGDGTKLVVMDFDAKSKAFSNPKLAFQGSSSERPGWPAFWPTGTALLFQVELPGNTSKEFFATRYGGRGELRWIDQASGTVSPLHRLNGKNAGTLYLPTGPDNHDSDAALAYEPTVCPIASGGYAWVVFMSRRLYGNVATINPWWSDPRDHDLTKTPTTKKLWVAALDLNPKAGADPSHPAFYLPAQELMAGNSRGFWVVDPCKPDGQPCEGGDECCGGFCTQSAGSSAPVCGAMPSGCSKEFDKCQQSPDCCDFPKFQCVNGHCARWTIE